MCYSPPLARLFVVSFFLFSLLPSFASLLLFPNTSLWSLFGFFELSTAPKRRSQSAFLHRRRFRGFVFSPFFSVLIEYFSCYPNCSTVATSAAVVQFARANRRETVQTFPPWLYFPLELFLSPHERLWLNRYRFQTSFEG